MWNNKLEVSEFDFDDIKTNLKSFLQSQSEFQDYDFEGSGFAVPIRLTSLILTLVSMPICWQMKCT